MTLVEVFIVLALLAFFGLHADSRRDRPRKTLDAGPMRQ